MTFRAAIFKKKIALMILYVFPLNSSSEAIFSSSCIGQSMRSYKAILKVPPQTRLAILLCFLE